MMVIAGNARAAEPEWFGSLDANGLGQSTNWFDAAMWRNPTAVPTSSDKAKINLVWGNPGPVINAAADVNQLYVAESSGALAGAQTLEVTTGGVLGVNAEAVLGYGTDDVNDDDGTLLVTGTGIVNCKQHLFVGYDPCAIGRLHIVSGTVDVNQMFGLSWNGGDGFAQLDGGTLITEEFTFENVAGGTAAMDIAGGTWIQKHFWWDEIRALVWNGKITGYASSGGDRTNVIVTWDPNASDPNEDRIIVTATDDPIADSNIIIVKQDGTGDYITIQAALDDVSLVACDVIEVQDDGVYDGNGTGRLVFPNDVNYLTLQAGDGNSPTITLSGVGPNTVYIQMLSVGQTIQGFNINLGACSDITDSNSTMILSRGGATTVRDCNITGPTSGWIRGITNVATIEDTEISNCRLGILCDINEPNAGFRYSISGSYVHDTHYRGITFIDCNAVMDDCLVELCGDSLANPGGNVLAADGCDLDPDDTLTLLITNSTIREALWGRNFSMETIGTVTIEDSIIMNALGIATHSDEILQYRGTLNLNRCIIKAGQRSCVNLYQASEGVSGGICNIDHCDIMDTNATTQWAAFTYDPCAVLTVTNSILTGPYGLYEGGNGTIISNWNDNFCDSNFAGDVVAGPNDFNPGVYPFYIQTDDASLDTFFALQPYSPVVNADEDGNYMGSQGPMTGHERWPGSLLDDVYGSDFGDFAVLALHWRDNNTIPAINDLFIEDFESYATTGELLGAWYEQLAWGYGDWLPGDSNLTLLTNPADANSGDKAMRWEYDVNVVPVDVCEVGYTEILVVLASEVNFEDYNELRVSLKRHTGNSPDGETFMYARFLNDIYGTYGMGGDYRTSTSPGPYKYADRKDVANTIIGGSTLGDHPDEYYDWTINFDDLGAWTWGHNAGDGTFLQHVGAIIFGIQTQPEGPYGHGTGTIDVDDIRLRDRPACSGNPAGDIHPAGDPMGNCMVNLEDVKEFALYWLEGK